MGRQGFIFSLDAFVAFTLISITIGFLIFTIGTPKPFYPSLEQAHQLAHDTMQVLATTSPQSSGACDSTYLELIMNKGGCGKELDDILEIVGSKEKGIIPIGYGYRFEEYTFEGGSSGGSWMTLMDSNGTGINGCETLGRCKKSFTKLQASATTFASLYEFPPVPGESPYCYANCHGYNVGGSYESPCSRTPCEASTNVGLNNATIGRNSIGLIRLVIYT